MQLNPSIIADFKAGRLDTFYAEAYPALLTYAARLLGEHHALMAEDCVQDAIFASYQQRDGIRDAFLWKKRAVTKQKARLLQLVRQQLNYIICLLCF